MIYKGILSCNQTGEEEMCRCVNVEIQSYDNQVELDAPKWSGKDTICIDKCLAVEIEALWDLGVVTTGCCCGHNNVDLDYIGVSKKSVTSMLKFGYKKHEGGEGYNFIPITR